MTRDQLVLEIVEALEQCMDAEAVSHAGNAMVIADRLIENGIVEVEK